jgi:hypothetical protein
MIMTLMGDLAAVATVAPLLDELPLEEQPASPNITTPASARQHCSRFRIDIVDLNHRWVCGENLTLIDYAGQVTITQQ